MKRRPDGRWGKYVTIDGKRKVFYSNEVTESKAEKDIQRQMLNFNDSQERGKTFDDVADEWVTQYRLQVPEITYKKCIRAAYNRALNEFGACRIRDITAMQLDVFINELAKRKYSQKTVSTHRCVLNMIFQYAVLKGYVMANPVLNVRTPKNLPKKKRDMPDSEEIKIVNSYSEGFDLLPYFLLYTGLRISEALAITDKDIDFEKKMLSITKHLIHDGNKPILEDVTKSESSKRTVILMDRLAEKIPKFKGLLFCNDKKQPYTRNQFRHRWKLYQQRTGVTLTPHQLRHAYATMLFEAGINEKDAQELMGHSDIKLTRDIYTHIRDERKEETARKLNDFNF